jgi:hypothetical protein
MATARQAEEVDRNAASPISYHPGTESSPLESGDVYCGRACVLRTRRPGMAAAQHEGGFLSAKGRNSSGKIKNISDGF